RQSTCGRPDTVVCCRAGNGKRASTVLKASKCASPCSNGFSSVGEGCTAEGTCVTTTTTTTTITMTTTTTLCGNGILEVGEECDPPGARPCPPAPDRTILCTDRCRLEYRQGPAHQPHIPTSGQQP